MHVLAVNSIQSLFNYYAEQLENTPTLAEIQATNKMPDKKDEDEEAEKAKEPPKKELTNPMLPTIPMMPGQVIYLLNDYIKIFVLVSAF